VNSIEDYRRQLEEFKTLHDALKKEYENLQGTQTEVSYKYKNLMDDIDKFKDLELQLRKQIQDQ